ncbi:hypothetical protein B0H34DRAFT_738715 [Crassisporium funariophilum]|nr:hypothetical protein B0H34DRAFT_738715 [Crassisporium funariophilum]
MSSSYYASTSSLIPSSPSSSSCSQHSDQPLNKWDSAFGALSSTYGFGAHAPSLPQKSTKPSKSKASPSTHSTKPPVPTSAPAQTQQKNWEAAFGALSSSYGFGGKAPSLPHKAAKTTRISSVIASKALAPNTPQVSGVRPAKNYEAAVGHLSSTYGFGGGVACVPSRV